MRNLFIHRWPVALATFAVAVSAATASAQSAVPWNVGQQGGHVTALALGGADDLWVGMQDWAVWNLQTAPGGATRWRQFTVKDGLGDNDAYALATDKKGRVWVGHLNHGVSAWNGASWRNYGVMDGPIGERVFDIAVCPTDGDVWIATDMGLSRYSDERDTWTNYTRADGLVSDQISAIAFDSDGDIYCGTQSDGLSIARAAENYENWTSVRANTVMPDRAAGAGLPSNLINDVLVAHGRPGDGVGAGVIYVATIYGLAWSRDKGANWKFVRGQDWEANVKGRILQPKSIDVETVDDELLQQDWTTSLSEDRFGLLWVGHLRKGYEVRDPETLRTTYVSSPTPLVEGDQDYVRAFIDAPVYGTVVGRYGGDVGGISSLGKGLASSPQLLFAPGEADKFAELPSPAAPPTIAQMDAMRARLSEISKPLEPGEGVYLGEDWSTQGDWVGRYGRGHATLGGMNGGSGEEFIRVGSSENHVVDGLPGYDVSVQPGARNTYGMVSWVNWPRTINPRSLFDPLSGYRRQSEWNDYGNELDVYPWAFEGPDLWVTVTVPVGVHRASLYFFNKDGQSGQDRFRDFPIELKNTLPNQKQMNAAPTLARARVADFWGGVYEQFALCGPAKFSFKVRRNHSHAVIIQGVFLDPMVKADATSMDAKPLSWMNGVSYGAPAVDEATIAGSTDAATARAARKLWAELDRVQLDKSGSGVQWPMRVQALRAAQSAGAPASLLANWRWQMGLWNDADRANWNATMARAFAPPPA